MLQEQLFAQLKQVGQRYRRLAYWRVLAVTWLLASLVVFLLASIRLVPVSSQTGQTVLMAIRQTVISPSILLLVGLTLTLAEVFSYFVAKRDRSWLGRQIEAKFPELNGCLLTAIELQPALADGRLGFLQEGVVREALSHSQIHDWQQVVSNGRVARAVSGTLVSYAVFITAICLSVIGASPQFPASILSSKPTTKSRTGPFAVSIEPGDTEIERGSSLLVIARIDGALPAEATLVYQADGNDVARVAMSGSLEDPVFGARIPSVLGPLSYRVEVGEHISPSYQVKVFEYPRLERADARLTYPQYTSLAQRVVQDIRTVSVVEGTELELTCFLNKPIKTAVLTEPTGPTLKLTASKSAPREYQLKLKCDITRRLKLELVDDAGRQNVEQVQFTIQVVPNQPPVLKLVAPGRDLEVSPLEELEIKATAWDDYGLNRMGVNFGLAGLPAQDVVLGENAIARHKHNLASLISFEDLKAESDQLLAYHFWAEDFGPDGKVRRTASDMYFAEVRHFDEIFREGQQPPGGQQQRQQGQQPGNQNTQQAQQLAQLQKDIINATWKLIRRETQSTPTAPFVEDVQQIIESQTTAHEQADELGEKLQDPESQAHLATVLEAMERATADLQSAHDQSSLPPLQTALVAEQSAYQALLKLRAREHEVVRQQQQQSSSSSSSSSARSQQQRQQLQQLDLKDEENRYETERLAQAQGETPEDRETRQILNRLRELSRRQHDLNERLKDLQSALQEATNEEKREEIKQQLKRLQDEQRDVLRDTDELQTRMDTPENQEQMAEERQQLEQARDQVQRASESLEKDQVTQAAAAGTRAESEFNQLKDEFRRRSSNRFSDEMRDMREAARELDHEQKRLSDKLAASAPTATAEKSLREDSPTEEIAQKLLDQKQKVAQLNERVKKTVLDAEQTEPLLSEKLQDVAREMVQQNVDKALDTASRAIRQGFIEDARQIEGIAGRGISQLKEGIEKAAESVLGDESEALRRAREELRSLAEELNQELARNAPEEQLPPDRGPQNRARDGAENNAQGPSRTISADTQQTNRNTGPGQAPETGSPSSTPASASPGSNPPNQRQENARESPMSSPDADESAQKPVTSAPEQKRTSATPDVRQPMKGQGQENSTVPQSPGKSNQSQGASPASSEIPMSANETPRQNGQSPDPTQAEVPGGSRPGPASDRQPGRSPGEGNRQQNRPPGTTRTNSGRGATGPFAGPIELSSPAPFSGEDFLNWSDRLRDVEEMVDDPELRAEAARIRDQARSIRAEFKRHSKVPNWKLIRVNVAEPLAELTKRVADELVRRDSKQAVVPLDRDPVPPKYTEKTRRYYERLGTGK